MEREQDGVRIIEHGGIGALDGRSVSFERRPSVRIGGEGPSEAIGSIAGFLRRPDGAVLIADGIASELRLYDAQGQLVRVVGRQGRGPGEYNSISGVFSYAADTVLVADGVGSRFSILTPDLEFVRVGQVPRPGDAATGPFVTHTLLDVFADGSLLVGDLLDACFDARQGGFCADSMTFYRMGQEGSILARFGTFMTTRTERAVVRRSVTVGFAEPHAQGLWAVHGDHFYYADGRRFEVQVFSGDGHLVRIVRVQYAAPSYSRRQAFWLAPLPPGPMSDEAKKAREELRARAALPDTFPAINELHVDDDGNIWVREYLPRTLMPRTLPRWFVFDARGHLRHEVRSPAELAVRPQLGHRPERRIGRDHAVSIARDEYDAESLVIYRILRQAAVQ